MNLLFKIKMNLFSCTSSNAAAKPSPNNQLRLKNLRWARFWYDWCSSQDGFHYHDQSWKKVCYLTSLTNKWSSLRNEADAASTSNYMVRDWVTELPWTVWNDVEWDGVLYIAACETYAMFVEFLEGPPVPIWYVGEAICSSQMGLVWASVLWKSQRVCRM